MPTPTPITSTLTDTVSALATQTAQYHIYYAKAAEFEGYTLALIAFLLVALLALGFVTVVRPRGA